MAEHTPTPWHVNDDRPLDDTSRLSISNGDARIIANIVTRETTHGFEGGSANAAFIVKAVNNHDALIDLLAEAGRQLEYMQEKMPTGTGAAVIARIFHVLAPLIAPSHT